MQAEEAPSARGCILILDFGSQFTQLIARRIREIGVYCEILPWNASFARISDTGAAGIVLSGSHLSTLDESSPRLPPELFNELNVPILGICYGMQVMTTQLGGRVQQCGKREYGFADVSISNSSVPLFQNMVADIIINNDPRLHVWMSHGDQVIEVPAGFEVIGKTDSCSIAAMYNAERKMYAVQFHPEVTETKQGKALLTSFLKNICGCEFRWKAPDIVEELLGTIRKEVAENSEGGDVLLALSGGVDSSVVAVLLHRAVGSRLKCVMVDNGLLRKNEAELVRASFQLHHPSFHVTVVDAREEFLSKLAGVCNPEEKRKIIGVTFIEVFERMARQFDNVKMLAQGTIYPDVIESAVTGGSCVIKTHHNVGGLPERMKLKLIEPIRRLFKDEVRRVGEQLGLPHDYVWRHPFPGPGLGVRILGAVDAAKCEKLKQADFIWLEELHNAGLYEAVSQAFAVLLPCRSVGVRGDGRFFDEVIAIRAVKTTDFMTARSVEIPWPVLHRTARRICNEVEGVSRVVYDLTDKPPATIEWE
eukprot:Gregarina_sp_Poly_1__5200@NODE_2756_length_1754_cov_148_709544_g1738_i0_p1_GENE_NODE_2756_length_1754_cov_148_709544_g1738_i0NODE_2756_length_1754_cov_148_709544_g1738_i0_p1_ORF_typecomplete_len534_score73_66GATase/PF00117_28/8e39GMP_synt_C/PF00958_22/6_7e38ThiI/PF02568_14/2_8e23NAD_synthase/PF02540_17/1_1e21Peptidase_C26/PF07722_13/5_8e14ATP_bind_3/PF01171_20/1_8e10Asn_synthase/PF00733_21/1_5e03Asn_synthase/PF00733_21/3_5e08tRNA_Me_trans/PF03054_16/1_7e06tRNA_Me_trans/PF03054_16/89QueC/PF06508_